MRVKVGVADLGVGGNVAVGSTGVEEGVGVRADGTCVAVEVAPGRAVEVAVRLGSRAGVAVAGGRAVSAGVEVASVVGVQVLKGDTGVGVAGTRPHAMMNTNAKMAARKIHKEPDRFTVSSFSQTIAHYVY